MSDTPSSKSAVALFPVKMPFWVYGFCLHIIAGFIATAAHYFVMYVLIRLGMAGLPASTLGFGAGAITRFLLSYFHVFSPTSGVRKAMFRFVLALFIQMVANSLLLGALMSAGLSVWVAQIATTAALTIFTYAGGKLWVFR
jgi:putative flippase GtrA